MNDEFSPNGTYWRPRFLVLIPAGVAILAAATAAPRGITFVIGLFGVGAVALGLFFGLDSVTVSDRDLTSRSLMIRTGSVDLGRLTSCRFVYLGGRRGRELRLVFHDDLGAEARVFPRGWRNQDQLFSILTKALAARQIPLDRRTARALRIR
jgi:hypothetical protein